ncbi:MAG: alpha-amylase domain-containing protein, partial [Planctomycetota bacterium]
MFSRGRLWALKTCTLALVLVAVAPAPRAHADNDVMLQGFWWDSPQDWWNKLRRSAYDFASSGFKRVWLPPMYKDANGGFGMGYGTFDGYDLGEFDQKGSVATRFGTRAELERFTYRLNELGVDPIGDMVLTHRTGGDMDPNESSWTRFNHPHGRFSLTHTDFDHSPKEWKFGENLDYWKDYVRNELKEWGHWVTESIGLKGFRIDQAKELHADYLREWLGHGAMYDKFSVAEYFDGNIDKLEDYAKRSGSKVFDFALFFTLREMANDRSGFFDMRKLVGAGLIGRNSNLAVTFAENHDTDRSQPISFDKMMAYSYILFSEGTPTVFLKDYWEYGLKDAIDPLIAIRRTLIGGSTTVLHADNNVVVLQRNGWDGRPGAVLVLNNHGQDGRSAWVSVKPEWAGKDLIDYTGNQAGKKVELDGRVELSAGPRGYAIYSIEVPGFDPKKADFAPYPRPEGRRDREARLERERLAREAAKANGASTADANGAGLPLDLDKVASDPSQIRNAVTAGAATNGRVDRPISRTPGMLGGVDRTMNDRIRDRIADG